MQAFKCDRCSRYYELTEEGTLTVWAGTDKLDLCPKCYRMLDKWVKMGKKDRVILSDVPELNGGFVFGEVGQ